jgi:hypothetical protein
MATLTPGPCAELRGGHVMHHPQLRPLRQRRVGSKGKLEGISHREQLISGGGIQPVQRSLDVPTQTRLSVADGIARTCRASLSAEWRIEAQLAPTPPSTFSVHVISLLMRERDRHAGFRRRVERDGAVGVARVPPD